MILLFIFVCWHTAYSFEHLKNYEFVQVLHFDEKSRNYTGVKSNLNSRNHLDSAQYYINGLGKNFHLILARNKGLLSSAFVVISQDSNGNHQSNTDYTHCYYHGRVKGYETSHVSLSTCDGLVGMIQIGNGDQYFIEPTPDSLQHTSVSDHILYKGEHVKYHKEGHCGGHHEVHASFSDRNFDSKERVRRSMVDTKKYVEVVVVMDNREFQTYGMEGSVNRAITVINNVDAVYKTLETRVALASVVVWNIFDKIKVDINAGKTLSQFRKYTADVLREALGIVHDSAQLITGVNFNGSTVGLAGVGVVCSRTAAAINQDQDKLRNPIKTSNTVAHELGHNLGFLHDGKDCRCVEGPCVMSASVSWQMTKGFTSCTHEKFSKIQKHGGVSCIYDYPEKLFGDPSCGNGYIEKGEECDCGTEEECFNSGSNKCCDPKTCMLQAAAQCSDGPCCENCKFKKQGVLCRSRFNQECDLEEYCTGYSDKCPRNSYLKDGTACEGGKANCYKGGCVSYNDQCQTLWGKNASKAVDACFSANLRGNSFGNCGRDDRGDYLKCTEENKLCGKLNCAPKEKDLTLPGLPIIGSGKSTQSVTGGIICKRGITSLGADLGDPTIALQGSKCGEGKMCFLNECTNISSLSYIKSCSMKCLNGGVCNNNGNCHCLPGYACPNCELAGPGGSFDSGQGCIIQGDCECLSTAAKVILILVFVVFPVCVGIGILVYRRKVFGSITKRNNAKTYKSKQVITSMESQSASDSPMNKPRLEFAKDTDSEIGKPRKAPPPRPSPSPNLRRPPPVPSTHPPTVPSRHNQFLT